MAAPWSSSTACASKSRRPIRRAVPGSIEQREFEHTRHGTVVILTLLVVHTGAMAATCLTANTAQQYIPALEDFRRRHRDLRGVFLVHDGGASHIAGDTSAFFAGCGGWWRPRLTPAHASFASRSAASETATTMTLAIIPRIE